MPGGGSFYRFELTRLEIAGVLVSSAASLFIVFLLGVYTGRGLGERQLADEERVVRLPVAPASEETPARDAPLTFDDKLVGRGRGAPAASEGEESGTGEERERPFEQAPKAAPKPVPQILAAHPAEEALADADDRQVGPGVGSKGAAAKAGGQPGESPRGAGAGHAPDAHATPAPSPQARVAVAIAGQPATPPTTSERGIWSVQVTATRDPRTADDLVRRLRAKGYDAYVVQARRQDGTLYRVRVGHFPSMEHASQMVSRLRREPGVPEAFVASE